MLAGVDDPLATVVACNQIARYLQSDGLILTNSSDFRAFFSLVSSARGIKPSPMFDPDISDLNKNNALWIALRGKDGAVVAIQALRLETIDTSLADWAPRWMSGLYTMRSELVVSRQKRAPENSLSENIRGKVAYHGELWINPQFRLNGFSTQFTRLGLLFGYLKWCPDAIWAVTQKQIATKGLLNRFGYAHIERGFFHWSIQPTGADKVEFLSISTRRDLSYLVQDTISRE